MRQGPQKAQQVILDFSRYPQSNFTAIAREGTGSGYAPSDADAPHFALDDIRERLKTMCGGTMDIEPREAVGTKVKVFIPMKQSP